MLTLVLKSSLAKISFLTRGGEVLLTAYILPLWKLKSLKMEEETEMVQSPAEGTENISHVKHPSKLKNYKMRHPGTNEEKCSLVTTDTADQETLLGFLHQN